MSSTSTLCTCIMCSIASCGRKKTENQDQRRQIHPSPFSYTHTVYTGVVCQIPPIPPSCPRTGPGQWLTGLKSIPVGTVVCPDSTNLYR